MKNQNTILKTITITSIISIANNVYANEHSHHNHEMIMNMDHSDHKNMNHENHENDDSIFVCPMHPEIMSEEAGTCPICKMALEKVSFDEE